MLNIFSRREKLGLILLVLLLAWVFLFRHDRKVDNKIQSPVLSKNDKEKLIVNPRKHTIEVITADKTQELFLPNRPSSITLSKEGELSIQTRDFGTETEPFIGLTYGDRARLNLGLSFLYYKSFDLNASVALKIDNQDAGTWIKPLIGPSYNVYDNTNLYLAVNPFGFFSGGLDVHGGFFVRF